MKNRDSKQVRSFEGQSLVLMLFLSLALVTFLGLVHDAGALFTARRDLQNVADAAARAGADELSARNYRALEGQGSEALAFDPWLADATARAYIAALSDPNQPYDATIDTSGQVIVVTLRREVPTLLLRGTSLHNPVISTTGIAAPQNR